MQLKYYIAASLMLVCLLATTSTKMVKAEKSVMGYEICKYLVATAEGFGNHTTKAQIVKELTKICSKMIMYENLCYQAVESSEVIDAIMAKEPPETACAQCWNGTCVAKKEAPIKDNGICSMCQLVVSQVENWAKSKANLKELETKLEKVCKFIPGQYSTLCSLVVEIYLPTFLHLVEKNNTALVICQDVTLC